MWKVLSMTNKHETHKKNEKEITYQCSYGRTSNNNLEK
jgi:hypothetical protein